MCQKENRQKLKKNLSKAEAKGRKGKHGKKIDPISPFLAVLY